MHLLPSDAVKFGLLDVALKGSDLSSTRTPVARDERKAMAESLGQTWAEPQKRCANHHGLNHVPARERGDGQ